MHCLLAFLCLYAAGASQPKHKFSNSSPHPTAIAHSANSILEKMLDRYDRANSFQGTISAKFIRGDSVAETLIQAKAQGDRTGHLSRSRIDVITTSASGKVRSVSQMLRVDNGKELMTYHPTTRDYYREPRRVDRLSNILRPLLHSAKKFAADYNVRKTTNNLAETPHRYILYGKSKNGQVWIHIDSDTFEFLGVRAQNSKGDELHVETIGQRWNTAIDDSTFRLVIPEGARQLPAPRPGGVFGLPAN